MLHPVGAGAFGTAANCCSLKPSYGGRTETTASPQEASASTSTGKTKRRFYISRAGNHASSTHAYHINVRREVVCRSEASTQGKCFFGQNPDNISNPAGSPIFGIFLWNIVDFLLVISRGAPLREVDICSCMHVTMPEKWGLVCCHVQLTVVRPCLFCSPHSIAPLLPSSSLHSFWHT
jgi:hypothetical protein